MEIKKENLPINQVYDVIVVGGGAGGLSAGIYAQRFLLKSLILDKGKGRSVWIQNLTNYLGQPTNTPGHKLLKQGKEHYLSLNGDYLNCFVEEVVDMGESFKVKIKVNKSKPEIYEVETKYLIASSGIIDNLPSLDNMRNIYDFAGYNLHVCMVCDGYEMKDKVCGFFASSVDSFEMLQGLNWFTPKIKIFTNGLFQITNEQKQKFKQRGFELYEEEINKFIGEEHEMTGVELVNGKIIELETGLISMGAKFHNNYLKNIKQLEWKKENLITDNVCRTTHSRIFAIGDLKAGVNQVSIAVGDGANASVAIWKDLKQSIENN